MDLKKKTCFKCGETKPLNDFYKHPRMADGRVNKCKQCNKRDVSENYRENITHYKEYDRKRANLPHRIKARKEYLQTERGREASRKGDMRYSKTEMGRSVKKKWEENNLEKVKGYKKKYKVNNLEKVKASQKRHQKNNPEKYRVYTNRRRSRLLQSDNHHTTDDIKNQFNFQGGLCNTCGKRLTHYRRKRYHVDHIIPLAKGGGNGADNIQLLCPHCNLSKHAKDPMEWAWENGRLF